jgi:raffinose/stachyose/melibiose transport system permease protein
VADTAQLPNTPVGPQAYSPSKRSRWKRNYRKYVIPWLFVLPIMLVNIVVVIGPSASAFYFSMTDWSGIGVTNAEFIGLENFRVILFEDMDYRRALLNNLAWLSFFLTVPFFVSLFAASMLARIQRGGMFIRTSLFVPYVLPAVITASIWRNLMSPTLGIGAQLAKLGIPGLDVAWLGQPNTALISIAFVDNWHFWGFLMVLFLSAMQSISPELYEAARIDGASRWQEFRHITIPGIRPTIVFMLLMVAIWSFLVFDYVWILTQGGPAGASEVLGSLVYKEAFMRFEAGYASAIGLTMSFLAGLIIGLFLYLRRRGWEI